MGSNDPGITSVGLTNYCPYCSNPPHSLVVHYGLCPRVKAIEYHSNGRIKRMEFVRESDPEPLVIDIGIVWPSDKSVWQGSVQGA